MRLIDADAIRNFPFNETSGTEDMIEDWIEKAGFDKVTQCEFEDELHELCRLVIHGMINVIDTEPTAYDVDKVVEELEEYSNADEAERHGTIPVIELDDAIDIVKRGGVDDD